MPMMENPSIEFMTVHPSQVTSDDVLLQAVGASELKVLGKVRNDWSNPRPGKMGMIRVIYQDMLTGVEVDLFFPFEKDNFINLPILRNKATVRSQER